MDHQDHVTLLRKGVPGSGGVWADLGSGWGAFTLALAELIGPKGEILSIDKDRRAIRQQEETMRQRFPGIAVHYLQADFTRPLALPALDGLVMANALHFVRQKESLVRQLKDYLRPGGRFLLVEYNTDRGNPWVPHPLTYHSWIDLARRAGFHHTEQLATVPSRFLGQIYSAASW